jgi:hypothetical protein
VPVYFDWADLDGADRHERDDCAAGTSTYAINVYHEAWIPSR